MRYLLITIMFLTFSSFANAQRLLDPMPLTMMAQDFTLPAVNGEELTLKEYRGNFVLVNFWSTECVVCRAELTSLEDLYDQLRKDYKFEVIAIHAGPDVEGVAELMDLSPVSYQMLMDMELQMGHWGIPQLPTSYLVTPDGNFFYRAVGTRVWNAPYMVDFLREVMNGYESATSL